MNAMSSKAKIVGMTCVLALAGAAAPKMDRSKLQIGTYCVCDKVQDEKHVAEMKECGIDFAVGYIGWKNLKAMDVFAKYGIGVFTSGMYPSRRWMSQSEDLRVQHPIEEFKRPVPEYLAKYQHPAIWGFEAVDEPSALDFDYLGEIAALSKDAIPDVPFYINLLPNYATLAENSMAVVQSQLGTKTYREHIEQYCRKIPLDYICYDFYVYNPGPQRRQELFAQMYDNFEVVADACRRTGRSFWYIPQCNCDTPGRPDHLLEPPSTNRLRFQAYSAMAYGVETIIWACWSPGWWTNNVYTADGVKTEQYEKLKTVNAELHRLGPKYMLFRNVATHHVGPFPQNVFDLTGKKPMDELDTGWFRHVRTKEGTPLLVGEMVPRKDTEREMHALFAVPSGDFQDYAPAVRTVCFDVSGRAEVRVFGPDGAIDVKREKGGVFSFALAENAAALIVMRR